MLKEPVDYFVYSILGMSSASQIGSALDFFIYETIKDITAALRDDLCHLLCQELYTAP